jgi:hypothetical protein
LSNPHWEALTPATRQLFDRAASLPFIQDFYSAGDTGLALYLGHRFSVDLDFFSADPAALDSAQLEILRKFADGPDFSITYENHSTFIATWKQVGISFFRLQAYPIVQTPLLVETIPLATLPEIGAMKLAAIIKRGTRKDLVDLYYLLQKVSIEILFEIAAVKYGRVRSFPVCAIRALAYFADAEALPMPQMLDRTRWAKKKKFLEHQAIEAGRKNLAQLWVPG